MTTETPMIIPTDPSQLTGIECVSKDGRIKSLLSRIEKYKASEEARITKMRMEIDKGWKLAAELRTQRNNISNQIRSTEASILRMQNKTRIRTAPIMAMTHRVAARQRMLRERETERAAAKARKEFAKQWRKEFAAGRYGVQGGLPAIDRN